MIRSIIKSSMQARVLVVALSAIIIFLGISQLRDAPVEIYPEYSPVYVEVQTEALGLSALEVEQILTVALEQDLLNGIAYLDEIWSESMNGLARNILIFEPGTDPMIARQVVAERMTQAHALPNVSKPPIMLQPYSSTSRVLNIGMTPASADMSLIDMSVLARWTIQPYLMGVEGVANVSIWGQRKQQMQVQVDPAVLRDKGVRLGEVVATTGEALWVSPLSFLESSTPGTGGFFDTPNQRIGIRHVLPITEPSHLANIALKGHPNMVLGDVANVVTDHQPLIGDAIINGQEALMLVVEKFPGTNTLEVTERVEDALEELKPGLSGIAFDTEIFRPADYVEASHDNVSMGLIVGFILMLVVLTLLFYDWKTSLISLVSITLSLLAGAYVLYITGASFNMMVIAGLIVGLGVIVDDAITSVENVRRRLNQSDANGDGPSTASIILGALSEMRNSTLFATCIILLSIVPLYFVGGTSGKFLAPFATSYVVAILSSLVVASSLTPALSVMLLDKSPLGHRESPAIAGLRGALGSGVAKVMQNSGMAYGMFGLFAIVGLALMTMLKKDVSPPDLQMRDLVIQIEAPEGTSRMGMNKATKEALNSLKTIPGIRNVAAQTGRAVMSDKVENVNSGEIWVRVDDEADFDASMEDIKKAMEANKTLTSKITTHHNQSLHRALRLSDHLYSVRVYGENPETLSAKTEEVKAAVSGVSGVSNVAIDKPAMESTLEVQVDLNKARDHDLRPGDVRRAAAILVAGMNVGNLFEGQKVFDVVVWGVPSVRDEISDVENLLVDKPDGTTVRLGDVAKVIQKDVPAIIRRESVSRYRDVSFDYDGGNTATLAANVESSLKSVNFPLEYHAELFGEYKEVQAARSEMMGFIIAGLIGILLLLQAAFWSWRLAFVTFAGLLVPLSGGAIVAFLTGGTLSMGTLAGLLAILAIATHQSVTLVKHFKRLELNEGETFGPELVQRGVQERFAPIMMTIIITAMAFLPFVIFGNVPGLEMINPMATVILGGLVTTMIFNLYVLPGLYLQMGQNSEATVAEEKAMMEMQEEATME